MAQVHDPYRVLGLPRGASLDEVKRAYRRLAKQHHPDSGGQRTLARFLEIQAAYEQLVGGGPGGPGVQPGSTGPRTPWSADAARADATRRAYGTRSRRAGTPRDDRGTGGPPGGRPPGNRPPSSGEPRRPDAEKRRGPRKATLGSTSYDEAVDQPFDPDWAGSSWYGTTSGTYWTLNPREYADPRKHGPEYQARARRAAEDPAHPDPEPATESGFTTEPETDRRPEAAARADPALDPEPVPDEAPTGAGPGWRPAAETSAGAEWSATPGSIDDGTGSRRPAAAPWPGDSRPPPGDDGGIGASPFEPGSVLPKLARIFDPRIPRGPVARLALALAGGIPVALWLAWLLGELSGCGRFAASCEPRGPPCSRSGRCARGGSSGHVHPQRDRWGADARGEQPRPRRRADDRLALRCRCCHQTLAGQFGTARSRILSPCPAARTPATSRPRPRSICSRCA